MDGDLVRKGVWPEYMAAGWTAAAAIAALAAGLVAGSIALIGFGLDGIITAISTGMLLPRLRRELAGQESAGRYGVMERKSLFAIGVAYFLLALYLLNESGSRLFYGEKPETSVAGLVLAVLSLIIMAVLAMMKLRTASVLKNRPLRDGAGETAVRGSLSLILLFGLGLNARFGWWWADPAAALLMLPLIGREGWKAIEMSKETDKSETTRTNT